MHNLTILECSYSIFVLQFLLLNQAKLKLYLSFHLCIPKDQNLPAVVSTSGVSEVAAIFHSPCIPNQPWRGKMGERF